MGYIPFGDLGRDIIKVLNGQYTVPVQYMTKNTQISLHFLFAAFLGSLFYVEFLLYVRTCVDTEVHL